MKQDKTLEINNRSKILFYLFVYFGIMHFIPFLNIFLSDKPLKTFLFVDSVGIFSVYLSIYYIFRQLPKKSIKLSHLDYIVLLFILLSIFSIFLYLQQNNPASIFAYTYGLHYVVFPVFLYFSVKLLDSDSQKSLLKYICYLNLFFVIIGFLMHFFKPAFYTKYLVFRLAEQGITEKWQLYGRMQSYYGSTAIGNIAGITILLIIILDLKSGLRILILSCMAVAALLSHQRGAIIVVTIAALYYLFSKGKHFLKKIAAVSVIIFIVFSLAIAFEYTARKSTGMSFIEFTRNMIVYDLVSKNIIKERLTGYTKGWNFFLEYPFGLGVGATLSAADVSGAHPGGQVVDANFMRILADLGLEGLILFILIIIFSFKSAAERENSLVWIFLISIYCLQMIGTNVLDSFYISHTFWLLLGIIDTQPHHSKADENAIFSESPR